MPQGKSNNAAEMYAGWLKQDSEELDTIRDCMENCADNILRDRAEKKLLLKLQEAEEAVKDGEGWLNLDELKALVGE